jgi:hypothetical protein
MSAAIGAGAAQPASSAAATLQAIASNTVYAARRLALSFGKAAWIASTTFLVLAVPLIVELDREQQQIDMEKEQLSVLTNPKA